MTSAQATSKSYCQWPPKVAKAVDVGYIEDTNGRYYPRDIGRSSYVNGKAVYQFGDTFAHDSKGEFVDISMGNAAIVNCPISHPQQCTIWGVTPEGRIPVNPSLVDGEVDTDEYRVVVWCFGGIVWEDAVVENVARGYTYFEKTHVTWKDLQFSVQSVGISTVTLNTDTGELHMTRSPQDDSIFTRNEPRFGSFQALRHGDYCYCYGHGTGDSGSDVYLARVPFPSLRTKSCYEYWDGKSYQADIKRCATVIPTMIHGSIHQSKLFQPGTGKDWILVGCNSFGDSNVYMGAAPKPEGPWTLEKLMHATPKTKYDDQTFMYCMYAHPWAYAEKDGEILLTWSEGSMRGGVVAHRVELAKEVDEDPTEAVKENGLDE